MPAVQAVERLVGLQAQAPFPPYFGLWSRLSFLAEGPLTAAKLGERLAPLFPGVASGDLSQAVRLLMPLVQVPPRAVWGKSGQTAYAGLESWLGREPHPEPSMSRLVLRYLAAFGPATVADVQAWSGLTGLREVVTRLRPQLVTLEDEHGRELYDLPEAPRPDASVPAPVRLLAPFDNLLLSHADRSRVISDAHRKRVITVNGQVLGTVLVDGFVQGVWKRDKQVVSVEPFSAWSASQQEEVRAEAFALLAFAEPGGARHDVRFV